MSFVFGLGLPSHIIEYHQNKNGCNPELGELPKIFGSPLIFLQRLKLATSNSVNSLGLPRPIIKLHPGKSGCGLGLGELPKILGSPLIFLQQMKLATSHLVHSLGLPKPIIKLHPQEKWVWPWARGPPPNFGVPL